HDSAVARDDHAVVESPPQVVLEVTCLETERELAGTRFVLDVRPEPPVLSHRPRGYQPDLHRLASLERPSAPASPACSAEQEEDYPGSPLAVFSLRRHSG